MMKNLGRTFIILIAAGSIALGWYAFSTTAATQSMEPPARPVEFTQTGEAAGEMSENPPVRPEGGEMGFSLTRVLTGMAANVGITAAVIVLVVLLRKLANRFISPSFNLV
ncbi:MAG: hypothetical protein AB1801_20995 [Chloroflexota bacterium]